MPRMSNVDELVNKVVEFRDVRGWKQGHTPETLAKCIMIESAELLEIFQWHPPTEAELQGDVPQRERVAEELADVLIYAFSLADKMQFDVADIVERKLEKNALKYPSKPAL